jgi:CDP-diglyceride synthetase
VGVAFILSVLAFNTKFPLFIGVFVALISTLSMSEALRVMGVFRVFTVTVPALALAAAIPLLNNPEKNLICLCVYTMLFFALIVINGVLLGTNFPSFGKIISVYFKKRKPHDLKETMFSCLRRVRCVTGSNPLSATKEIFEKSYKTMDIKDLSMVYMMVLVIAFSLEKIVTLSRMGEETGRFYVFLVLGIAWISDTGAYFSGIFFGKNKLCPKVSPKKTLEGFLGGIAICTVFVTLTGIIFDTFIFSQKYHVDHVMLFILGLIGSLVSALGDLCFSIIKRSCHVKDFGNVIPGHGGILDRFDSVIFVAPYVYLFLQVFSIIF